MPNKKKIRGFTTVLVPSLAIMAGCTAYDGGGDVKVGVDESTITPAARNCPRGQCDDPPDPPDPGNPPPPHPTQPPIAKARFIVVPTEYIQSSLNLVLGGTLLQVTHTTGESLPLPGILHTCQSEPNDDVQACLDYCNNEAPVKQRVACRAQCGTKQVCTDFCSLSATSVKSFVQWGPAAKFASPTQTCSSSTCPACATPTPVPSLEDEELPVPVFHRTIVSIPGLSYDVTCRMNQWQFRGDTRSLVVTSSEDGIRVRLPGSTASPSVICDNAPNVDIDNPAVELKFSFPANSVQSVRLDADLEGDIDTSAGPVVDYLADIGDRLKDAFASVAATRLNTNQKYRDTYQSLILGLVAQYIKEHNLDHLALPGRIDTLADGLKVQYWTD